MIRAVALILLLALNGCSSGKSASEPQTFIVKKGAAVSQIARDLKSAGLIQHVWMFMACTKLPPHTAPHPGVYTLESSQSACAIWRVLQKGPAPVRITFPEGWTSFQMATVLEQKGVVPAADFLDRVRREKAEGMLFPDTYLFSQGTTAETVVVRMRERFQEMRPADWDQRAQALRLSPAQLLILASMVEREAVAPQERPVIAGVFLNRLRKNWRLESCATVQHALSLAAGTPGLWKPRLLYKDLEIESPFNTYRQRGLPPEPIGNPGRSVLEASARPAVTDAMFFVADGEGTHRFSAYYKDHLKARKKR